MDHDFGVSQRTDARTAARLTIYIPESEEMTEEKRLSGAREMAERRDDKCTKSKSRRQIVDKTSGHSYFDSHRPHAREAAAARACHGF